MEHRIPVALKFFPCDVLFVHRDEEGQGLEKRISEINLALHGIDVNYVPIVPVRMSEAWLLSDEDAIRSAAGKKGGRVDLKLPLKKNWESLSDPKTILFDALNVASEKSGRALKKFNPAKERGLVARRTTSFSGLRGLEAFDLFEAHFVQLFEKVISHALD